MGWFSAPEYWLGRLALERGTAIIYLIAFVAAAQQFRPLIGEHGMLPVPRYLAGQSFWRTPSIGLELSEVSIQCGLRRPLAGAVGHHQRRVEGDQAIAHNVGPQRRQHGGIVASGTDPHQTPVRVDSRDTGRIAAGPGEVHADEVHLPRVWRGRGVCAVVSHPSLAPLSEGCALCPSHSDIARAAPGPGVAELSR